MAQLLIRNLEERVKEQLRLRAEATGRSMEAEVRDILQGALDPQEPPEFGMGSRVNALVEEHGFRGYLERPLNMRYEPPVYWEEHET